MPTETYINEMTAEGLREDIIRIAQKKKMSYDLMSRRCSEQGEDVSKSTISAFFTNPDLDLGYKKLMALSRAVSGYDVKIREFTEPLPLQPAEEAEYLRNLMEAKKDRILDLEEKFSAERAQHKAEIAEERAEHRQQLHDQREDFEKRYDAVNRDKRIWRGVALFVLFALFAFCLIDLIDTDSGWIQSAGIQGILNSGFVSCVFC